MSIRITLATIVADILRNTPGTVPVDELARQASHRIGYKVDARSIVTAGKRLRDQGVPVYSHRLTVMAYEEAGDDRG